MKEINAITTNNKGIVNNLQVFANEEFGEVRTLVVNDEIWFSGEDVVNCLAYDTAKNSYSKYIKKHCDEEDYLLFKKSKLDLFGMNDSGRKGEYLIKESAIYSLIFGSKLESAKKFKRWITSEVLPSIRKNGGYIANQENMTPEQIVANALVVAQNIINEQNKQIEEMKPKVYFADAITASDMTISIDEAAKILTRNGYETGRNKLIGTLKDDGVFKKTGKFNVPLQTYIDREYFEVEEYEYQPCKFSYTSKITQKGLNWLIKKYCN